MKQTCFFFTTILLFCGCMSAGHRQGVPDSFFFTGEYSQATGAVTKTVFYDCATGKRYRIPTEDSVIRQAYRKHFRPGETAYCILMGRLQDSSVLHITRFLGFQATEKCMPVRLAGRYTAGTDSLYLYPDYTFSMSRGGNTEKGKWGKTYRDEGILIEDDKTIPFVINYGTDAGDNNMVLLLRYDNRSLDFLKDE